MFKTLSSPVGLKGACLQSPPTQPIAAPDTADGNARHFAGYAKLVCRAQGSARKVGWLIRK